MSAPIKNAANELAVRTEEELVLREREQELADLRALLKTGEGRRFLWRLMTHCKVFGSVFDTSSRIYRNSGMQDVGHFVLGEVTAADEDSLFKMMSESRIAKEARASALERIHNESEQQGATDV